MRKILGCIRKADNDFNLITDNDRIAVGVSGGKDSMILLRALSLYRLFSHKTFTVVGIHIKLGFPNMDFSEVIDFCKKNDIEFHMYDSQVYEILKLNANDDGSLKCSLCSKFKKAAVIEEAKKLNCNKVAFGHHSDDAVETLLMNAIYGGRLATFKPIMYLSRTDITFIRPLIYAYETDIRKAMNKEAIPFVKSTCPNDGYTQRQEMKDMLNYIYKKFPNSQSNLLLMLSNMEQLELWDKEEYKKDPKILSKEYEEKISKK